MMESCTCFQEHDSIIKCREEEKRRRTSTVTAKIISCSPMISVHVGLAYGSIEVFYVHEDLLMLHSGYVEQHPLILEDPANKIKLHRIRPSQFADFVSWIYTGNLPPVKSTSLGAVHPYAELWAMGSALQAPSFQNFCLDEYRNWCKKDVDIWPCISDIEKIYDITSKGSLLRQFAAHVTTCRSPFAWSKSPEEVGRWTELLDKLPDLVHDMAVGRNSWGESRAWDDAQRDQYAEKEVPIEERWDALILEGRTKQELTTAVIFMDCRKSKIELEHLEREKSSPPAVMN